MLRRLSLDRLTPWQAPVAGRFELGIAWTNRDGVKAITSQLPVVLGLIAVITCAVAVSAYRQGGTAYDGVGAQGAVVDCRVRDGGEDIRGRHLGQLGTTSSHARGDGLGTAHSSMLCWVSATGRHPSPVWPHERIKISAVRLSRKSERRHSSDCDFDADRASVADTAAVASSRGAPVFVSMRRRQTCLRGRARGCHRRTATPRTRLPSCCSAFPVTRVWSSQFDACIPA
jgi:hypothetical protein